MQQALKILIVCKSRPDYLHYRTILEGNNNRIHGAGNSFEALRLFNTHHARQAPFDLVMLEYILSGRMTGIELAELFIKTYPAVRLLFFPSAHLFEQEVRQQYRAMEANLLEPNLSQAGLRQIMQELRGQKR